MKWRAFGRIPQWVRLSEWLGVNAFEVGMLHLVLPVNHRAECLRPLLHLDRRNSTQS